jgi:hypothetical protein
VTTRMFSDAHGISPSRRNASVDFLLGFFFEAVAEHALALLGAAAAVLLHPPAQRRQILVVAAFGVLGVLLERPNVLETEVGDGDHRW